MVVIVYVHDILVYAWNDKDIEELIVNLQADNILLWREGTAEWCLGIKVEQDGNKTTPSQPGWIKQVIEALRQSSKYSTDLPTPTECAALPRDVNGQPTSG